MQMWSIWITFACACVRPTRNNTEGYNSGYDNGQYYAGGLGQRTGGGLYGSGVAYNNGAYTSGLNNGGGYAGILSSSYPYARSGVAYTSPLTTNYNQHSGYYY